MRRPDGFAARAGFGLHDQLLRGVVEDGDADVIVVEMLFHFGGDLREHLVGIERGDGVAGDVVDQGELARFFLLLLEEPRVFHGDAGFAGQDAQEFHMALVERVFLRAVHGHHADGAVVANQRDGADRAESAQGSKPRRSASSMNFSRISSGCPVRTTYSIR